MNACVDCKHYQRGLLSTFLIDHRNRYCLRPGRIVDPVTGEPKRLFASLERGSSSYGILRYCGPEGRYWEKR